MSKKYHRTTIRVTVLSEGPLNMDELSLQDIHDAITVGDCVGKVEEELAMELSADEMAEALVELRSDPAFFDIPGNTDTATMTDEQLRALCEANSVRIFQSEDDEDKGRWVWRTYMDAEGSDTSFDTEREAMVNAILELDLE